jgi:hypothetical protein
MCLFPFTVLGAELTTGSPAAGTSSSASYRPSTLLQRALGVTHTTADTSTISAGYSVILWHSRRARRTMS